MSACPRYIRSVCMSEVGSVRMSEVGSVSACPRCVTCSYFPVLVFFFCIQRRNQSVPNGDAGRVGRTTICRCSVPNGTEGGFRGDDDWADCDVMRTAELGPGTAIDTVKWHPQKMIKQTAATTSDHARQHQHCFLGNSHLRIRPVSRLIRK